MTNTPEQELRNILQYCWGYETDGRDKSKDYKTLKKYIQKRLQELEGDNDAK
jgi:hypothetical protein